VFQNRVLRRTFGHEMDEVTGGWRRLHKKELYALFSSSKIISMISSKSRRWVGHIASMEDRRGALRIVVRTLEEKRPIGRPTHICR
jgi:hypothetical protein